MARIGLFDDLQPSTPSAPAMSKRVGLFDDLQPKQEEKPAAPKKNEFSAAQSAVKSFAKGATLNFKDELVASLYAASKKMTGDKRSYGEIYDRAHKILNEQQAQSEAEHPVASTLGEISGGLATAAVPGGAAVKGATLLGKAGRGALAGAGYGAVSGAGAGEGVEGRLAEAGKGAVTGAGTGAIVAPIANLVGKGAGAVKRFFGTRQVAKEAGVPAASVEKVGESLKGDIATGSLRKPSRGDMMMNMGPQLQSSAEAIATQPGRGSNILRSASYQQKRAEGSRIKSVIDRTLGRDEGRVYDKTGVEAERKAAGQLYESAKAVQKPVYIGPIRQTLDDAIAQTDGSVRSKLEELRKLRAFADPKEGTDLYRNATDLHAARIEIDDAIDAAGKGTNAARLLRQVRREVDSALKESVPGYARADIDYKAAMDARDALQEGRRVFTREMSPDELAAEIKAMQPSVRERYLKGARDAISMLMGTARNDAAAVRRELFEKGWNQEKLAVLVGPQRAATIQRSLEQAANRARGHEALTGNSRTAERLAAQKRFPGDTNASELSAKAREVNLTGAGLWTLVQFGRTIGITQAVASKVNRSREKVREGAAKLLSAQGSDIDVVLDILKRAQKAKGRALNVREQYEALTNAAALSGSQAAQ